MNILIIVVVLGSIFSIPAQAEIYQTIDEHGRVHFSDSPKNHYSKNYPVSGYNSSSESTATDTDELKHIAADLKKERLQREKLRKKERSKAKKKRQQQKKKAAAKKKKIKACKLARIKEDKAFRKRMKAKDISQLESALEKYEKKREIRKKKCQ